MEPPGAVSTINSSLPAALDFWRMARLLLLKFGKLTGQYIPEAIFRDAA